MLRWVYISFFLDVLMSKLHCIKTKKKEEKLHFNDKWMNGNDDDDDDDENVQCQLR